MQELTTTTTDDEKDSVDQQDCTTEHACACGEKHTHQPGTPSHRESCTSTLKFGDTCCCGTEASKGVRNPCGHGPRCH